MEATSAEVEVKKLLMAERKLLVARYLERLNEARYNLRIRIKKIEHLMRIQDFYVSSGLSEFTTLTWTSFKTPSRKIAIVLAHFNFCCKLATPDFERDTQEEDKSKYK